MEFPKGFRRYKRTYKRYTSGKNSIHIAEGSSSSVKRETSGQEKESETPTISQSQTFANKNKKMENYTLPTKLLSTLSKQCNSIFRHFVTGYVKVCVDKQEPENRGQSGLPGWTMLLQDKVDFLVGSCHCCQAHLDVRVGQCVPSSATSGEQGSTGMTRCRIPAALSPVLRA